MELLVIKALSRLLMPPGLLIVLMLLAFLGLLGRRRLGGMLLLALCLALTATLSLPVVGKQLIRQVEVRAPLSLHTLDRSAGAIVVLGGGLYSNAPEFQGQDVADGVVLERLRYGVFLQRRTGLPLLVTGGSVYGKETPESLAMAASLRDDFHVEPKWVETRSRTTRENARYSQEILARAGISKIYLVTHARHMRRALREFQNTGLRVIAAPTRFTTTSGEDRTFLNYVPSMGGLSMSSGALYEILGGWWYRLTG
jgi:uncharacterized SAM-binding protein YcdF (DUF218 family)